MLRHTGLVRSLALILLFSASAFAQTSGAFLPWITPQFTSNGIAPLSNGFVCTTASGGTTPLATFQDSDLMTANQNPIRLNSAGQPVNGSAFVSVYLQASRYRFTLYAAGTGTKCNGVNVGSLVRQVDDVYDYAQVISAASLTLIPGPLIVADASSNAHLLSLEVDTGANTVEITTYHSGGASDLPMTFRNSSGEMARFDTSSRLLLGIASTDEIGGKLIVNGAVQSITNNVANASFVSMQAIAGNYVSFTSDITGGGTYLPMIFVVNNAQVAKFETSGRAVFGITSTDISGGAAVFNGAINATTNNTTNASYLSLLTVAGNYAEIASDHSGAGADLPMIFVVGPTETMKLDQTNNATDTAMLLFLNGSVVRVHAGSCTVAAGTHSCLYVN